MSSPLHYGLSRPLTLVYKLSSSADSSLADAMPPKFKTMLSDVARMCKRWAALCCFEAETGTIMTAPQLVDALTLKSDGPISRKAADLPSRSPDQFDDTVDTAHRVAVLLSPPPVISLSHIYLAYTAVRLQSTLL